MIKALRRRFIIVTMCAVVVVLFIILGTINIANYYAVNQRSDELLELLADNNGAFPKQEAGTRSKKPPFRSLSPEAPFETRYFTVLLREDQAVVSVNTGRIAAVTTQAASQYAVELYAKGKTSGFQAQYKFRAVAHDEGMLYIFLDCERELTTFTSFLLTSCLVALVGSLAVLALVVFFSKLAMKPVAQSYEKQKRFITDASHEIKTPLTIIDASAEVLEMDLGESEWTRSIKNQIKRLSALTEKLVFLSRMDEESTVLQMTDFSLTDAVVEAAQPFLAVAAAQGKTLEMQVEKQVSYCGEEALLRQLTSLLLDNAMKYSNEHGRIILRLKTVGKSKELTVFNTVDQIAQGKLEVLFERFYRLDASRSAQTGGQGIGLSVAKAIVAGHKGKISARSEDGKSICFTALF